MDHTYNPLPFPIRNSNSYSLTSQTFILQGSHIGPPPVMPWGGSPVAEQPLTWPPPPPSGYRPPPPSGGYWPPPPPTGHRGHSSSTHTPSSGYEYWPPPPWGMPPWTTPTPQPQRPSSSPPMVGHSCLLSIVPFVIRANVERLAYSSIYVFKHPSSSAKHDFIDWVLNMGGSSEGESGGTDMMRRSCDQVVLYVMYLCHKMMIMYCCEDYGLSL
jgi:hypothetical protein